MTDSLHALAAARGGVFTTAEATSASLSPAQIRTRVNRGEWRVLRRGYYCFTLGPLAPLTPHDDHRLQTIAVLTSSPGAAASHRTAAMLYDLPLLGFTDPRTHATYDPTAMRTPSYRRDVNMHAAALTPDDVWVRDGLLVTRPARTVIDVARWVDLVAGVATADAALGRGLVERGELDVVLQRQERWPLVAKAAAVVALADAAAESPLESFGRVVMVQRGVDDLVSQVDVHDTSGFIGRADFGVRGTRCLIEADGMLKYDSPDALREEKIRQERLERAGFFVVRFTWADLERRPDDVVARVKRAVARSADPAAAGWWRPAPRPQGRRAAA
jgi:hypothetical protein